MKPRPNAELLAPPSGRGQTSHNWSSERKKKNKNEAGASRIGEKDNLKGK